MKFPKCSEVCNDCGDGRHVFHVLNELANIWGEWEEIEKHQHHCKRIKISGYAEDELWLEDLLRIIALEVNRTQSNLED